MSKSGKFWGQLETAFGKGNVNSGYRTQEEQDALVARGVTKATKSSHTYADGYDLAPNVAKTPEEIRAKLASQGLSAGKIIYETGKGKNQGTGAHWHIELGSGSSTQQAQSTGGGGMPQDFLSGLQTKLGPETASSQNVKSSVDKVFSSDAAISDRRAVVESNLEKQGAALGILNQTTEALQAVQVNAMQKQVEDTKAISKEITDGIQVVEQKVKPIFQARARIADQLAKVATMNPLERGLRGIFDLNYDQEYLTQQAARLDEAAKITTSDFKVLDEMHQYALREVGRRYGLETALPELAQQQASADTELVGLTVKHTNDALESLKGGIAEQVQMVSFKKAAREDMISRLDTPTLMAAATEAQKAGGVTMLNGVEVSYRELFDASQNREQQDLNAEAYRMSIASNRMDFATKYATNYARTLTRPQLEAAIRNGGKLNGVEIPQDVLTELYSAANKQAAEFAQQQAMSIPNHLVASTAADMTNLALNTYQKVKTSVGLKGAELLGPQLRAISVVTNNITAAVKSGTMTPEQAQIQLGELAKQTKYFDSQVDKVVLDSVGGDKTAAGYVKSFMSGVPMGQGTALEALTYFAIKGGLPDGLAASPGAKQVFQQARAKVLKLRSENPKISQGALQAAVQQEIESSAKAKIGDMRFQRAFAGLPQVAAGAGLQFGKLDVKQWNSILTTAKNDAVTGAARLAKLPLERYVEILKKGSPLSDTPEAKAEYQRALEANGQLNALEQRNIMDSLDELPQIAAGRSNSSLYRDVLKHPSMQMYAKNLEAGASQAAFGDYLVSPIGSGGFESYLEETAKIADNTRDAMTHDVRKAGRERALMYSNNPIMRTSVILSTIPGVGKSGAQALTPFIQSLVQGQPEVFTKSWESKGGPDQRRAQNNDIWLKQDDTVFAALSATKFDDPNLEAYRKTAIKGWKASATQEMGFMEKFMAVTAGAMEKASDPLMTLSPTLQAQSKGVAPLVQSMGIKPIINWGE